LRFASSAAYRPRTRTAEGIPGTFGPCFANSFTKDGWPVVKLLLSRRCRPWIEGLPLDYPNDARTARQLVGTWPITVQKLNQPSRAVRLRCCMFDYYLLKACWLACTVVPLYGSTSGVVPAKHWKFTSEITGLPGSYIAPHLCSTEQPLFNRPRLACACCHIPATSRPQPVAAVQYLLVPTCLASASLRLPVYQSASLPVYQSASLPVYLSTCLLYYTCLPVYLLVPLAGWSGRTAHLSAPSAPSAPLCTALGSLHSGCAHYELLHTS